MPFKTKKGHPNYYKGKYDKINHSLLEEAVTDALNGGWRPKARKAAAAKCGLSEATFVKYAERCATEMLAAQYGSLENARQLVSQQINGGGSQEESQDEPQEQQAEPITPKPKEIDVNAIYRKYGMIE